jgi:uroporphyrinogen-III synthase
MQALITRSLEDAEELAGELRQRGLIPVLAPLLTICNRTGVVPQLEGVQALLLTSANGARAFAAATHIRDLPVYVVGDATARTVTGLGFGHVKSADGDVEDLARLVSDSLDLALFFSPRTAAAFVTLVIEADLASGCERVAAYALSSAVCDALAGLPWRAIGVAARPDQESLLAVLDADCPEPL